MNTSTYIVIVLDSVTGRCLHRSEEFNPYIILSRVRYFLSRIKHDYTLTHRTVTAYGFTAHSVTIHI